jgi:hypothetical protein
MDPLGPDPLIHSFEMHLYAENRSAHTVTAYLISHRGTAGRHLLAQLRQQPGGRHRADLKAFMPFVPATIC